MSSRRLNVGEISVDRLNFRDNIADQFRRATTFAQVATGLRGPRVLEGPATDRIREAALPRFESGSTFFGRPRVSVLNDAARAQTAGEYISRAGVGFGRSFLPRDLIGFAARYAPPLLAAQRLAASPTGTQFLRERAAEIGPAAASLRESIQRISPIDLRNISSIGQRAQESVATLFTDPARYFGIGGRTPPRGIFDFGQRNEQGGLIQIFNGNVSANTPVDRFSVASSTNRNVR